MIDHAFVALFALIYPIAGFVGFRRLLRRIDAGIPVDRKRLYFNTVVSHWVLFTLGMTIWAGSERHWSALGISFDFGGRFVMGGILVIAAIAFLAAQLRHVAAKPRDDVNRLQNELGNLSLMIPRNSSELMTFDLLSLTAGVVEEVLWRGFLIWYLSQFMPLWSAAIISAAGFGIAHGYQGVTKIPHIAFVGAVFAGLYVLSGSLWLPMILHAAVDLLQGRLAYDALRSRRQVLS